MSRSTAYRLVKLARDEEKAERAFLDDRHGHPYKLTEPRRVWMTEFCTDNPQIPSSRVQRELKSRFGVAVSIRETQSSAGTVWGEPPVAGSGSSTRGKKLKAPHPVWQEGIGCLLLLAAAKPTGLLDALVRAIMEVADPTIPGLNPPNPAVVARLILTLLFLPVAGLARTWDLRSYTGAMLAVVTGRPRAYSQRYTERFLARLAHAGAAQRLTEAMAKWTWSLWQTGHCEALQPNTPAVFYVDGHRKAVYSDVLVPRGKVGQAERENPGLPRTGGPARCPSPSASSNHAPW